MKILRTVICAAMLVAGLSSCEKLNQERKIDYNKLEGTWTEQYDPTVFAMDGSLRYTFDGDCTYQLHVYNALGGESSDYTGRYVVDKYSGTIALLLTPDMTTTTYNIVKLTSTEMEWQKEGTTYSQGTWASDYRHFVKSK
ncbi:MAG: hypothetical protein J6Y88_04840 [Bacteroidales bacterium]|nr:hypothetical protein [Bacteroidales bacterium]